MIQTVSWGAIFGVLGHAEPNSTFNCDTKYPWDPTGAILKIKDLTGVMSTLTEHSLFGRSFRLNQIKNEYDNKKCFRHLPVPFCFRDCHNLFPLHTQTLASARRVYLTSTLRRDNTCPTRARLAHVISFAFIGDSSNQSLAWMEETQVYRPRWPRPHSNCKALTAAHPFVVHRASRGTSDHACVF